MSNLALYLRALKQASADQLYLNPGEQVTALVEGQRKTFRGEPLEARALLTIAGEVLSQEELRDLPATRPRIVRHEHEGEQFVIEVSREGQSVKLAIRSAARKVPAPTPLVVATPASPIQIDQGGPKRRNSRSLRTSQRPPAARASRPPKEPESGIDLAVEPRHPPVVIAPLPPPPPSTPPIEHDHVAPVAVIPPAATVVQPRGTDLDSFLREMLDKGASDLHLSAGNYPVLRVHGEIAFLRERSVLTSSQVMDLVRGIMTEKSKKDFEQLRDADFAHEIPNLARFRVNVFEDRNGVGAVFRQIPIKILTTDELGLPKACLDLCYLNKGLVVVTGPTGSGKSTTLAAMIDHINKNRTDHIITIEDPVEFVHPNIRCLVNQREVGQNTKSFKNALRAALREDPDIVLVGEMRDLETIAIAIETAETGHLVFGTLHTTTATSTIDRIIDQFPSDRQAQIRVMLSESLKGVIAQVLLKKIGGGRAAAHEILLGTPAVSALIRDGKTFQLPSIMQTQKGAGMRTLNDSLLALVQKNLVDPKEAWLKAIDKSGLVGLLKSANIPMSFG